MKQTMRLDLSQRLTMTPALQQAIRMLQLSTLDLKTEIRDALESNLMLETEEPASVAVDPADPLNDTDSGGTDAAIPDNLPVDADWSDVYAHDGNAPTTAGNAADAQSWRDYQQANLTAAPDLHEHLTWQADMHPFTQQQRQLASHIIDAIDANGLLDGWPELNQRLCTQYELSTAAVVAALNAIQSFDPPGVGARGLAECLAIQLRQHDDDSAARRLALALVENDYLDMLAAGRTDGLVQRLNTTQRELAAAHALLQTLQPHPGEIYTRPQADYVVPEVIVSHHAAGWQVRLNPDIAPHLRINSHYQALIHATRDRDDRRTLKSHLQEARFFLHSLHSRNETLLQVAQCIVEAQRGFLDYGPEAMQPLVLHDVSNRLNIHESTVSRATANKFMQTPRGIFELKHFFSSQVATTDGGHASATAIQAMIKRLVAAEDAAKPLSDSKLAERLHNDAGIQVARRTIAKYREQLAIAPSSQRKRRTP